MKQENTNLQQDKVLYVGTSEKVAKLAPVKGLNAPIFLTDVYPTFFCKQTCNQGERWGIISVSLSKLHADVLTPSPYYIQKSLKTKKSIPEILSRINSYKSKWQKSLEACGVCLCTSFIPPTAIKKVIIYEATNPAVAKFIDKIPNPEHILPSDHKTLYRNSLGVLQWLNGEEVSPKDVCDETDFKMLNEIGEQLLDRSGLNFYYLSTEKK